MKLQDRIYYTGDMANADGWFVLSSIGTNGHFVAVEDDGERQFFLRPEHVGTEYNGHCSTRFVTEGAFSSYRTRKLAQLATSMGAEA